MNLESRVAANSLVTSLLLALATKQGLNLNDMSSAIAQSLGGQKEHEEELAAVITEVDSIFSLATIFESMAHSSPDPD